MAMEPQNFYQRFDGFRKHKRDVKRDIPACHAVLIDRDGNRRDYNFSALVTMLLHPSPHLTKNDRKLVGKILDQFFWESYPSLRTEPALSSPPQPE